MNEFNTAFDMLMQEFNNQQTETAKRTLEARTKVINSHPLKDGSWTSKIVSKVRISDLAAAAGIDKCPKCEYDLYFDDARGFFCCATTKWKHERCFAGNIVDFQVFLNGGRK